MTDIENLAETIHEKLPAEATITVAEIEERLDSLVNEYQVPVNEAQRTVQNNIIDDLDVDSDEIQSRLQQTNIGDIDEPDEWIDVTAKVVDLWEPRSESIGQVGLLGDETGTIRFVKWKKSGLPELQEGEVYYLESIVTDEYEGSYSVKLNSSTTVKEADVEITVNTGSTEVEGALVDIQTGSGLIKRCRQNGCSRVLREGLCAEHGEIDGEFDLRIKGVLDDGESVQEILFDRELTESLTEITLEEAIEMAKSEIDRNIVVSEMEERTLGRYYRVTGSHLNRYFLVDTIEELECVPPYEELLIRGRSLQIEN
ncbi:replication factor A [Halovenus marina]|uniref:replication factor A n=1 Tax=Halovenus marina TaxID=3396621 RepID=UPI003F54D8B1